EAVEFARKHRDQLLKGVELFKQVPRDGTDNDYSTLQDALDIEAPDVSRLGWGHKYFHLIFPEKLDQLHTPDFQRFHLLKLLQQLRAEKYRTAPQAVWKARSQIFNFVLGIAEGDIVLAADGGTVLGVGRVTGPYSFDSSSDFPHRRPVQWLSFDEWKMPEPE